ncbi:hypothetical protein [Stigmatella aurantiaca]|uniref:hypothetical protein n=1 Tax=Stigmatella aurantiaca TaxID=41 RepID=UPI000308F291|nr:hypothetical protein [Stigmatella aurantiaca]
MNRTARVEREIDRSTRAFGLFFDVFSQWGTRFAPALAACDAVAAGCFQVVRSAAPDLLPSPLLKPLTSLEHSFSQIVHRGVLQPGAGSRLLNLALPGPFASLDRARADEGGSIVREFSRPHRPGRRSEAVAGQ